MGLEVKSTVLTVSMLVLVVAAIPPSVHASSVFFVAPSPLGTGTSGGDCTIPGFNTIKAAVTAASSGDMILVCPGTYYEEIVVDKSVTIRSTQGAALTIVDAVATTLTRQD